MRRLLHRLNVALRREVALLLGQSPPPEPEPVAAWTPERCADWLAGYEWALTHPTDEGVVADLRRNRGAT